MSDETPDALNAPEIHRDDRCVIYRRESDGAVYTTCAANTDDAAHCNRVLRSLGLDAKHDARSSLSFLDASEMLSKIGDGMALGEWPEATPPRAIDPALRARLTTWSELMCTPKLALESEAPVVRPHRVYCDLETSGLSADVHCILQVGVVLTDPTGDEVLLEREWCLLPREGAILDPGALAVSGIDPRSRAWRQRAVRPEQAFGELFAMVWPIEHRSMLVNHNVSFDARFLLDAFARYGHAAWSKREAPWDETRCVLALARQANRDGWIQTANCKLHTLCDALLVTNEREHTALADARRARLVHLGLEQLGADGAVKPSKRERAKRERAKADAAAPSLFGGAP